jgi:hypothetical protein
MLVQNFQKASTAGNSWHAKVCWAFCFWCGALGIIAGQTPDSTNLRPHLSSHQRAVVNPVTPSNAIVLPAASAQSVSAGSVTNNLSETQAPLSCTKLVYQDRLLSVNSPSCPLDDVLNAIHNTTGIRFDGLTGVAPRMVLQLGPAPLNVVVRQLLKDSPFDYFIMGDSDAPKVVRIWRMPPSVVYERGLLTVKAQDSTLADVLRTIHDRTGIQFEGATGSSERVAVKLGPAPAVEVLNELFRGSRFNFVVLGSQTGRQQANLRVILSSAGEGTSSGESFASVDSPQADPPPAPIRRRGMILVQPLPPDDPQPDPPAAPPTSAESQQAPTLPGGVNFIVPPQTGAPPPQQQTNPVRRGARPPE